MNEMPKAGAELVKRESDDIAVLDLLIILARRKILIISLPLFAAAAAFVVSMLMTSVYTATARVLPPQQASSAVAMLGQLGLVAGGMGANIAGVKNPADMYIGLLKSRTVADAIVQRFKLQPIYGESTLEETRKVLEKHTAIEVGRDGIISVSFDDPEKSRAAAVANAYVEELDRLNQTLAVSEASQRRLFFERQLKIAKDGLTEAEIALKKTQETTGLIKLDDQGRAIIESVARLRAEIAAKEVEATTMRSFATVRNPDFVRVQEQVAGLKAQLTKLERADVTGVGNIFVPTGKVPESGLEYLRRLRDVKYNEAMFELLAKQYEVARIDEAKDVAILQVVDRAVEPEKRSKPKKGLIVLISAGLALILAMVMAFVLETAERAKRNPDQAARMRTLINLLFRH